MDPFWRRLFDPARRHEVAIQAPDTALTYGALQGAVTATASRLAAEGVQPGTRVALLFANTPEHVVAVLAVLWLGAVAVPLDPDAGRRRSRAMLEDVEPVLLLTEPDAALPEKAVPLLRFRLHEGRPRFDGDGWPEKGHCRQPVALAEDAPAFIRYSSGSTGRPKGVILPRRHLVWLARTLARQFGFDLGHRELLLVPMAYSGGWQRVAATLYAGGRIILAPPLLSVGELLETVRHWRISGFFTPPPWVHALLSVSAAELRTQLHNCRTIEIGSAPLDARSLHRLRERLPQVRIYLHYGLTECSRTTLLDVRRHPDKLATVGRPLPGVRVRIVRDGEIRLAGEAGEIQVCGPQMASGYWRRPGQTRRTFHDGWIATGDWGWLDDDGFLVWRGRLDDRINCGGFSFFPAEVEAELGPVPGVQAYLIAGVPDPRGRLGQVPWAFIVAEGEEKAVVRRFLRQARRVLPAHQVPRWVVPVPEITLTPSGKPDRRRTVERYANREAS